MNKNIRESIAYERGIQEGLERGKRECHRVIAIKEDLAYEEGYRKGFEDCDAKYSELYNPNNRSLTKKYIEEKEMKDQKAKFVEKRWGHEIWFANNKEENYCGKELFIKEECHTSMHFHLKKHEVFYVLEGQLRLELIDTKSGDTSSIVLNNGDKYEIEQGYPHQLIAHNGAVRLIEASTFHQNSDSYRIYDELR